jgi:hypothetical protein
MNWRHPTAQDMDHRRDLAKHDWRPGDNLPTYQRLAVSALVGECEMIIARGALPEADELTLRMLIAQVLGAFGMPSQFDNAP